MTWHVALPARLYFDEFMTSSAEKFEILSAFLDNEASPEECRLVEQWIECDPLFRQQYQVQLRLKTAIRSLSTLEKSSHPWSIDCSPTDDPSIFCTHKPETYTRLNASCKPESSSYMPIAQRGKEFIIVVAAALSAVSLTAFSYSNLKRSSGWKQLRRTSVLSSAADAPSRQTFQSAAESY